MGQLMRGVIRMMLTVVLAAGLWAAGTSMAPTAKADVEMLMVPSAAMGRDIPVAFPAAVRTPSSCSTRSTPPPMSATG